MVLCSLDEFVTKAAVASPMDVLVQPEEKTGLAGTILGPPNYYQ